MANEPPKRHRNFGFTWNNYPEDWEALLDRYCPLGCIKFCRGGREVAPETGTPHIQGHFDLANGKTMSAMQKNIQKKMDGKIMLSLYTFENDVHCANNRAYCYKEDVFPFEYGTEPKPGARSDLGAVIEAISSEPKIKKLRLMEEFPLVCAKYPRFVTEYRLLKVGATLKPLDWEFTPNLWIYGPPGVGKSRPFQEKGAFLKAPNKWWDGYDGDDIVLIEDLDITHGKFMGYFLKIWGDRYPFPAQIKGGIVKIRPKRIVVTSNFSMRDVFGLGIDFAGNYLNDSLTDRTLGALSRRFLEIRVKDPDDINDQEYLDAIA